MFIELLQNVAVLVALIVGFQMLSRALTRRPGAFHLAAGALYGAAGIIGMMTPLHFAPGIIYDGRSIVLSLAGLFGGPVTALVAAVICGAYRLSLGGGGALAGVLVVVESAALGVLLHYLRRQDQRWVSALRLWIFGVVVHLGMLALQLLLPAGRGWEVLPRVGPAVLIFYPLGFLLVAKAFLQSERAAAAEAALQDTLAQQHAMITCSPLALYSIDTEGKVLHWNESAERLFGWGEAEVLGRPLPIIPADQEEAAQLVLDRLRGGESITGLEVVRRRKDGSRFQGRMAVSPLMDEAGRATGFFGIMEDITERKKAEAALQENEERFRALVEGAPDAIYVQTEGRFAYLNRMALEHFGASGEADLLGSPVMERFHPDFREEIQHRIRGLIERKEAAPAMEQIHLRLDGAEVPVEVSAVPTVYDGKDGAIVFARNIAARKDLEQRLFQAQKMEAVGRLAGGVAHDFNNMLQTILGYTELLLESGDLEDSRGQHLEQIRKAANRSADLTRQLLGFARKQVIAPRLLDLNERVTDLMKMLERLIGEDIDLLWKPAPEPCQVLLDPTQMDQILANLVVNSRDAIPGVGRITIETGHVDLDEAYCRDHAGFRPGRFATLVVSDNGAGMDRETLSLAFEPFFTTKELDKGTGLGLATVFGIVKQNDGFINIYSEPGQGTTVRIYLNRAQAVEKDEPIRPDEGDLPLGTETVLLVEDEPALLELSREILEKLGYTVVTALNPTDALSLVQDHNLKVDLLMTDVIMPQMSGRQLWEALDKLSPGLPCLYMSGYTSNVIAHQGVLEAGVHFLQKPFSGRDLAHKLREVLAR